MAESDKDWQENITIPQVEAHLKQTESCIEKLDQAVNILPRIDEDGDSECPFAKELYEQKEKAQKEVAGCLNAMHVYQQWCNGQIKKCSDNLVVVSANADRLNNDVPKMEFTYAEVHLAALYKKLVRLKVKVKKMIEKCHKAIHQASQKQFPGYIQEPREDAGQMERTEEQKTDDLFRKMLDKNPKKPKW